ncbi:MAG: M48 family metalloprotease [Selenomonadaceae bacterium]|nr:M48 family metalloprotease [Selenomonadaceae bacterium]
MLLIRDIILAVIEMKKFLIVILVAVAAILNPAQALAADAWAIAAEALGVLAAYQSTLKQMLALGNNVDAQMAVRKQDREQNGVDKNKRDVEIVDSVMTRLVKGGQYELKVNSLPFVWSVNDSEKFNAACYPMNYISVNRGLVRGLNCDENQIAAVLAHEMTHGLEQHSAKSYAQAVAQQLGAMMLGANLDNGSNIDWGKFSAMVDYSIAKNISVPVEYEADEGGFYLMTSAGFNPGGGAAAMNRLDYYVRYETQDILEFDVHDKPSEQTFSDHPDTEKREAKLAQMMSEYGGGHVIVRKVDRAYKVLIDGREIFYSMNVGNDSNSAAVNAYYFAGGLSRAFHDYDSIDGWNFRRVGNQIEFLNDDFVYRELRELTALYNLGEKVQTLVELAYKYESPRTRERIFEADENRKAFWAKIKADADAAKAKAATQLRINADIYNDHGEGELALKQIERALNAKNQDDIAECLAIRGRAKAICGDYDGALVDVNAAVDKDPANLYNFLNRADVRHMRGELALALEDIDRAVAIDEKNPVPYKLQAEIFDESGQADKAEESYRKLYELTKKNPRTVPLNYLEKIDPKAAEKIRKKKDKKETTDEES